MLTLVAEIENRREAKILRLLEMLNNVFDPLLRTNGVCTVEANPATNSTVGTQKAYDKAVSRKRQCNEMMLGTISHSASNYRLWPLPSLPDLVNESVSAFAHSISVGINVESLCDTLDTNDYSSISTKVRPPKAHGTMSSIHSAIPIILRSMPGLQIKDFQS